MLAVFVCHFNCNFIFMTQFHAAEY